MKVGIVVPYSWSFWGGVVEHAEDQAEALEQLGVETRIVIGHDPPGRFSGVLHPRKGRYDRPPSRVIPVGRSVIVPSNDSLANIVISPSAVVRLRRVFKQQQFDLLHIHEPLTPAIGVAALVYATSPMVGTFHAAGDSRWRGSGMGSWGFLLDRLDLRIAVSEAAHRTAQSFAPGEYTIVPNGVRLPDSVNLDRPENHVVFVGRHERRKGLEVILRAWPAVHKTTGARLRVIGTDPLAVRYLLSRCRLPHDGIDLVGIVPSNELDAEIASAKLLVAPALGSESFGMVITRAFAAGTPVVASDIDGYRQVVAGGTGLLVPPGDSDALAGGIRSVLADEAARRASGERAREVAEHNYGWPRVASRLLELYEELLPRAAEPRLLAAPAS